jgi:hypothetical protein
MQKRNVSAVSTQSNSMNFVLWFMGSKQDPNGTISKKKVQYKKQVITSGSPNRLLIKAFLKKRLIQAVWFLK